MKTKEQIDLLQDRLLRFAARLEIEGQYTNAELVHSAEELIGALRKVLGWSNGGSDDDTSWNR